jgi:hypothetical protein
MLPVAAQVLETVMRVRANAPIRPTAVCSVLTIQVGHSAATLPEYIPSRAGFGVRVVKHPICTMPPDIN